MDLLQGAIIALAGLWAGTINSVVGSGTLVTFPVLVALGYAPVVASISNATGLVAGNAAGAWGYRKELAGLRSQVLRLLPASILGGIIGAWLLLHLPESVFGVVAPILIVLALLMVIFQPRLQRWVAAKRETEEPTAGHTVLLTVAVFLIGIYGGYFVAAQGILLVAVMGILLSGTMQTANAMKNVLVLGVNLVAAASYLIFAFDRIAWPVVAVIAVTSTIGGFLGAKIGRRLKPVVLRSVIVLLGLVALYFMVAKLLGF
ncbi:sulfite exporter TauE/SafE family protein [Psychromicrobium lacuslunae]|uniref:Probable membrane transporter protein n=1 Tax=Psychromicrobium lacuslunae TaxID=1618207 RepID=A0A0D4BX41_9MICC|nr:sulfite exporter TauE/SafE family protein [Psychromicrobium lacuslunae]AJT40894.1 membrane protein [Psychromicrobium lacuslunae]